MVIDTSAVVAILLGEPEARDFIRSIERDPIRLISALNVLECQLVIESRKGPAGGRELDLLLHHSRVEIVALTESHIESARSAWRRYGKGNHAAGLNICDCCAYALSKISGEPLLYEGGDFTLTDVIGVGR